MSAFAVALVLDEYGDWQRVAQDLLVESCMEMEAEDYEWDEADEFSGVASTSVRMLQGASFVMLLSSCNRLNTSSLLSDEHKRGLVRRYVPSQASHSYNYARTYIRMV